MRRREFITFIGSAAAAWPLAAHAEQAEKVYRVGFLANDPTIPTQPAGQAFLDGLRESGFIEGKNIIIERRFAEAKPDRYPDLVADLIALRVDVIVTSANSATLAAKQVNTRIPIVMMNVSNPLGLGFAASLALPGGNITGVTQDDSEEIATKRLQILKDVVSNATRVAVLMDPDSPGSQSQWQQLEQAVRSLNVTLWRVEVRQRSELEGVLAAIGQDHPDALFVANSELNFVNRSLIMRFAIQNRLPTISSFREYPEAGGLISYGFDRTDQFRRAAIYVGKILKGKKPADLPIEQPTKYELVVNLKTAKSLGLAIPPMLLATADEVIE